MTTETPAVAAIQAAARYAALSDSARVCLRDAEHAAVRGDWEAAQRWACKSLAYSVGVFHPAYRRAAGVAA